MENKKPGRPRVYLTEKDFHKWRDGTFFHFKVWTEVKLWVILTIVGILLAIILKG